jgi:alpha-glucosidase
MIIYQIYPRSYQDTTGNGIGDLPGITKRLAHIASLNAVDYVWISPFFTSPMKDYGYDVSDYRQVDPIFGTNADFDDLIKEANRLGLKIMVDLVLCHTSNEHPWFKNSSSDRQSELSNWYVWHDPNPDGTPPNNWLSHFGGSAWHWESKRQQFYLGFFLREQPALNWHCQEVEDEMCDIVSYWLSKGVKGFRLDAIQFAHFDPRLRNNPPNPEALSRHEQDPINYQLHLFNCGHDSAQKAMQRIRGIVNQEQGTLLLGEIADRAIARKYTGDNLLHSTYFFDFFRLRKLNGKQFKEIVESVYADFPDANFFWALSNHDFMRHVTRLFPANIPDTHQNRDNFAKLLIAIFALLPGGYCMYQGEELGLPAADLKYEDLVDPFDRFIWPNGSKRDTARTPIPWDSQAVSGGFTTVTKTWLPIDKEQLKNSVDLQNQSANSVLQFYRQLLAWRKNHQTEYFETIFLDPPVSKEDDTIYFEVKFYREKEKLTLDKSWLGIFNLSTQELDFDFTQLNLTTDSDIIFHNSADMNKDNNLLVLKQLGWIIAERLL